MSRISKSISAELSSISQIKYHLQIAKVPLCLLVGFSSVFGFALSSHRIGWQGILVFFSVFLLACGAASLNSFQEYRWDRKMERTRRRPVARGVLPPEYARFQAQILLAAGLFLLLIGFSSPGPAIAGIVSLCLYNFIYTPLKYATIWAIVPGAVCGAIPVYIGWLAGEGTMVSPIIAGGLIMLMLWQIPHFWLVVLANKSDYRESGIPNLAKMIEETQLRLVSIVWVTALVTVVHTLIVMFEVLPAGIRILISISSLLMLVLFSMQMGLKRQPDYRYLFILLNVFMLLIMALFTVGSLVA